MKECEAPIHQDNCNGIGNSKDHFTARAIGKVMGWSAKTIKARDNIQWLSVPCHRDKDKITVVELDWNRTGGGKPFGAHANEYLLLDKEKKI